MIPRATPTTYIGLFLVTLATLLYETLLTRLFSVTMYYHYAFMAISLAMFGMTVGALGVYLAPSVFPPEKTHKHMALGAWGFAVLVVLGLLTHLAVPFSEDRSLVGFHALAVSLGGVSLPFLASGVCVALALSRFPAQLPSLYAADLLGAALGCLLLVQLLHVMDGPSAVLASAALASLGSGFLSVSSSRGVRAVCALTTMALAGLLWANLIAADRGQPLVPILWLKGQPAPTYVYERWSTFSRVCIQALGPKWPFGWGLSPRFKPTHPLEQLRVDIDAGAGTYISRFDGGLAAQEHLKFDICNAAHYLRTGGNVLVIGVGGGRDVLSALLFGHRTVVGVELNEEILKALTGPFGSVSGHIDRMPGVTLVNDEARSYLTRTDERFDVLQVSLIDTWAATAAGAFALSENSLYTVEAWKTFLERLTPTGILTVSRFYYGARPGEMYRLATLATESLLRRGITDPRRHILIARVMPTTALQEAGVGTLLVSPTPFSEADVKNFEGMCQALAFDPVLTPRVSPDPAFARIVSREGLEKFLADSPIDVSAPTDDRPFFFNMLKFSSVLNPEAAEQGEVTFNLKSVKLLAQLLVLVLALAAISLLVPLWVVTDRPPLALTWPHLAFFIAIGLGFMLVEVSLMQRLIVFLGHPAYALSVVLFSLLLFSGLGSAFTGTTDPAVEPPFLRILVGMLFFYGFCLVSLLSLFQSSETAVRVTLAAALIAPIGFVMGMPFALGMRRAHAHYPSLAPLLWGANGAASIVASVLSVAIAMAHGISTAFWAGAVCYAVASLVYSRMPGERS